MNFHLRPHLAEIRCICFENDYSNESPLAKEYELLSFAPNFLALKSHSKKFSLEKLVRGDKLVNIEAYG